MHENHGSVAILIQGYTLKALNILKQLKVLGKEEMYEHFFKNREWLNVVMGNFKTGEMGRAMTGLWLALTNNSPKIIFGTGASCIIDKTGEILSRAEWGKNGRPKVTWESEYTLRWIFENFDKLKAFPDLWQKILSTFPNDPENPEVLLNAAKKWLFTVSSTDSVSWNTGTEVEEALKICYDKMPFLNGIIRVTNPCHLPRSLLNAHTELRTFEIENVVYECSRFIIYGHPCKTDFKKDGESTFILEPMSGPPTEEELSEDHLYANEVMNDYWSLPPNRKKEFLIFSKKFFKKSK